MIRCVRAVLILLLGLSPWFSVVAEEVPPLKALRKPVAVAQEVDEGPVLPVAVAPERMVADPATLCPDGAVWYVTVPDAARMVKDWNASPSGALINEPSMANTFKNNRFGLGFLFSDLPESVITPERVGAVASVIDLSNALAKIATKMAMACYIDEKGSFNFLFVFDVGPERTEAFETIGEWETYFFLANPGTDVKRGNHAGNYLDTWFLRDRASSRKSAEIVAGFAENMAIVSNSTQLATAGLELLAGRGANIADSKWGRRLAASQSTSATADAIAFLRMDELLRGLNETPIARNAVNKWADYLGHGGRDGEAIYYGLEFTKDGSRETFLLPASGQSGSTSLMELLAKRLRPSSKWASTPVVPYQPIPSLFFAALLEGRQLGSILRSDRRLFGSSDDEGASFAVPPEIRNLFSNDMMSVMTGEIGMAIFPESDGKASWMIVLPCTSSPAQHLPKSVHSVDRTDTTIHSVSETEWRNSVCWTALNPERFRRLPGHSLVIASDGDLMLTVVDQLVSGSSFANNRDFSGVIANSEDEQGMIFYVNTPEILVRLYPHLSGLMRGLYPRSSGLNSRPPLAMLRRYAKGVLGVISPTRNGEEFTRVTVQAPLPTLGALGTGIVLAFPRSLREDGRRAMEQSRENMQNIWLRLQLYASRFGHFPDSLDDLAADMRSPSVTSESIRTLFTAPAALSRLTARDAATQSYRYLSGVTPTDEPDIPILYEAQPWSEDFIGQYPDDENRGKSESGDFIPFRQYIRLDGKIVTMPEKRFLDKVLPRLKERE